MYQGLLHTSLLLIAGMGAGLMNAVAGAGSIILYPLLLSFGVSPIVANATSTIAVGPGALASAYGYRTHLGKIPNKYYALVLPCGAGGLVGALLLRHTSNQTFKGVAPLFILLAVALLAVQPLVHAWLYKSAKRSKNRQHQAALFGLVCTLLFGVAVYGGYFGAGIGIMLLAFLGFTELTDIQQVNGLKNLASVTINATATVYFIAAGLIYWRYMLPMTIGTITGGLIGATYGSRLPAGIIRTLVITIGLVVGSALLVIR